MADRTREDILREVKERNVQFIRLQFTDMLGTLKSFAITAEEMEDALDGGMGFDGSSITGFNAIEESDMIAMPDVSTFQIIPWSPEDAPTARLICDVQTPDGDPYVGDPRYVLKRALQRAEEMGFDKFYVGPELEFFYFKDDSSALEPLDRGSYFDLTTLDAATRLRRDTVFALQALGIKVEYSHHEVAISQHEIDLRFDDALTMADKVMTYKTVVKEIATQHGVYATFMPKPLQGENGSGMHTHQSLFQGSRNAFFDPDDQYFLSDTAKAFIAGQLKHARELAIIFAQNPNSYKRLVPGFEAPVYIAWSRKNRSALVRVPGFHPGQEKATRMELRCPDPSANIYLLEAALLHAGLEGIEKGYELPEPMERNLYDLSREELDKLGIESLPGDLGEAIMEAENSELLQKALGDHVYSRLLAVKRQEWDDYRVQVTPYEVEKYLPIL
ncbi:GlnA: glutamine synthetase, type I [Rubrobacter radiotolerans]|uniref:Glutamine synthetase n=1 Tax=Rubrobacter radiotolerans TaxID=42256 RepID=A0A023X222_RUBRA|nr:type I glutamate--ammonia ligase [Rubrobacter radiotolerans]AHY46403.1 GlnA: glutamine synthetase, type I [Rubrobacter radiotolerans]MDX5893810.1 type I glutamate--ammonia ligase [Rubrobacter radiotolerans]SMC04548.1 glutamine synthetase [Rubrobacter radiotolerans DSM 5868]